VTASSAVSGQSGRERIVVGVDGSAGSSAALRWAIREATLHGVTLHAVHAWEFHSSWAEPGLGSMFPIDFAPDRRTVIGMPAELSSDTGVSAGRLGAVGIAPGGRADAQSAIENELDTVIADALTALRHTSVTAPSKITQAVVEGHAAQVLFDSVTDTDLLVVGSRGHGELAGTLLGTVSQHLVAHAPCAVVVVPHHKPEGE
jgi:nucleotide-binding universal stress UspA family protein